ncbi:MAG: MiaB/RimO family radical SAM methylthiotransferase, partial [Holosporales bacterium]
TFCVVPYTRGAEYSRPVTAIVEEAKILIGEGAREITLLGQNVNAYHHGGVGLGKLLFLLAALPGLDRLRYTTSHPRDVDEELIEAHKNLPSLMPLLHLPVQSGSDKILAAMNRRHTADDYRRVIDRLKNAQPSLQFTSDFIVGFPGETDADFAATLRLVKDVTYAAAFSFKYSPRPGTPAAVLETQVPEAVKTERLATLQALLGQQQHSFNLSLVGTIQPVLIMEASKRPGIMFGKTPFWQSVLVTGNAAPGSISPVLMEEAAPGTLHGRVIDNQLEEATAA